MLKVYEVDEIADGLLDLLVQDSDFLRMWEQKTAEALENEILKPIKTEENIDQVTSVIEELVRIVDLATQCFLDNDSSIYKFTDETVNPDAAETFAVDLQMQRLEACPNVQSGCHVANLLKFSISLDSMLFRIEEQLRNLKGSSKVSVTLSKCASDFNRIVVEKLEAWKADIDKVRVKSAERPTTPLLKTPKRRPLSQLQRRSPGGFLMSPEIARQKLHQRSRSVTPSKSQQPAREVDPNILQKRRQLAGRIEKKWAVLLAVDTSSRQSLRQRDPDEESSTLRREKESSDNKNKPFRVAKQISAQVIRDLRKSLGGPPLVLSGQL